MKISAPEGWTDDMKITLPAGKRELDLVLRVLAALIKRERLASLLPVLKGEFALKDDDVALAIDRIQGGVVRAVTGHSSNGQAVQARCVRGA
jgi:hypothetical protein